MVSGAAALVCMLVAFIALVVLIMVAGRAIRAALALDKGDADTAFRTALKAFVVLSFVAGAIVLGAVYKNDRDRGLYDAIRYRFGLLPGMLLFLMVLAGQLIALVILVRAWRKRRRG